MENFDIITEINLLRQESDNPINKDPLFGEYIEEDLLNLDI